MSWEAFMFTISGLFSLAALLTSTFHIYHHLSNWTLPSQQRHIVRLILMVPVYSVDSWLSLRFRDHSLYFDVVRDCYEAYALYQFFALLVAYIEEGGERGAVVGVTVEGFGTVEGSSSLVGVLLKKGEQKHPCPLCCLPSFRPGPVFLVVTKQFILQYVLVKPLMAIVSVVLYVSGFYHEGSFSPSSGYLYVAFVTNLSVTLSMYFLVLFYLVTEKELAPNRPIAKFFCIKSILFFSFWQSVFIGALSFFDVIPQVGDWKKEQVATGLQDFVICIEMFLLSVSHLFVFSTQPYKILIKDLDDTSSLVQSDVDSEGGGVSLPFKEELSLFKGSAKNFKSVVYQEDILTDLTTVYSPDHIKNAKRQQQEMLQNQEEEVMGLLSNDNDDLD